jgi:hypothetical protein
MSQRGPNSHLSQAYAVTEQMRLMCGGAIGTDGSFFPIRFEVDENKTVRGLQDEPFFPLIRLVFSLLQLAWTF